MKRHPAVAIAGLVALVPAVALLRPAAAAASCAVDYSVTSQWQGGFQAAVTVTNAGAAVDGWTLTFAFPDAGGFR